MRIEHLALMTEEVLVDILFFLALTSSPGPLPNNAWSPKVVLNENITALFPSLLNLYGFNLFSKNSVFPLLLQLFGVITKVQHI